MSATSYAVHGDIAVITLNHPPLNAINHGIRQGVVAGINQANADERIKAIVLLGGEKAFSAGADVSEFNTPAAAAEPSIHSMIDVVEGSGKPTIAAISGMVMGGGLELALGCNFRIARPTTLVALPEVKLGILPGAGGTQRLPRLVGLERAAEMIVKGDHVPAAKLADTRLFDGRIEGDLLTEALAFANQVVQENRGTPRVRDLRVEAADAQATLAAIRAQVENTAGPFPAPRSCVDAIEASLGDDFDKGLQTELQLVLKLLESPESKALRHAFFGERAASKIPDVPVDTPIRPIEAVGVIGAGTMGGGIAMNFLNAGMPVVLLETSQEALDRGLATIRRNYDSRVRKGRMTQEKLEQRMALITPTLSYSDLASTQLVIEAVFEDMAVKQSVFEKLDEVMPAGAVLASNTSTLDLNQIASFTRRPQDVIGMHFFSPANVMRLLEVVRGAQTAKDVLATVMKLGKRIRKLCVVAGVCDGFIGNRMIHQYGAQAGAMLREGAMPEQIDRVAEEFGMAMGPFRMGDLAGLDVGWYIRKRHYAEHPEMPRDLISDALCERGRFGQKTGAGWYRYEPGDRRAHVDPEVENMIRGIAQEQAYPQREISDEEIRDRLIFALVNEGARILEEGIALRASDIDMVYLNGYGFPLHRGGPMHYANELGLGAVVNRMREFASQAGGDAEFWEPARLLVSQAAEGGKLM